MWVDCHAHVNFEAFADDWREVVDRSVRAGVGKIIVVGADLTTSQKAVELAQQHPALWAAVGIHPHHSQQMANGQWQIEEIVSKLRVLAQQPRVVAIGEIGLDYHVYKATRYKLQDTNKPSLFLRNKELQKQLFEAQLQVAQEADKPVIIHSRECGEEVLEVIKQQVTRNKKQIRGVFHCFGGSKKYLKKVLAAGFYVSFTGQITYVPDRADVASEVPLERLLVETDCPYMPAFAKATGGKPRRSEPKDVIIIGLFQAEQRGIAVAEVERVTTANAQDLFRFK